MRFFFFSGKIMNLYVYKLTLNSFDIITETAEGNWSY